MELEGGQGVEWELQSQSSWALLGTAAAAGGFLLPAQFPQVWGRHLMLLLSLSQAYLHVQSSWSVEQVALESLPSLGMAEVADMGGEGRGGDGKRGEGR